MAFKTAPENRSNTNGSDVPETTGPNHRKLLNRPGENCGLQDPRPRRPTGTGSTGGTGTRPQVPAVEVSGITDAPPQVQNARRQTPSGLNDRVSSNNGVTSVSERKLTLAEVDNMSADVYKKRIQSDPTFLTTVEQLQKEADLRRAARQRQS